jgi:hypothetical protein
MVTMVDLGGNVGAVTLAKKYVTSTKVYGLTDASTLWSSVKDFRVTGFGLKLRNVQPPSSAIGMIEVAQVPVNDYMPGPQALDILVGGVDPANLALRTTGLGSASNLFYSLLNLPISDEFSVQELMSDNLEIVGKINGPQAYTFKSMVFDANLGGTTATYDTDDYIYTGNQSAVTTAGINGLRGCTSSYGRSAIAINLRGFPASTKVLDVEIVLHLEGTPATLALVGFTPGNQVRNIAQPGLLSRVSTFLSSTPVAMLASSALMHVAGTALGGPMGMITAKLGVPAVRGTIKTARAVRSGKGVSNVQKFFRNGGKKAAKGSKATAAATKALAAALAKSYISKGKMR